MISEIYHYFFQTPIFPIWVIYQYFWASMVIGNAKSIKQFCQNIIRFILIGIFPFVFENIITKKGLDSLRFIPLIEISATIFIIFQILPTIKLRAAMAPFLIPIHKIIVMQRFLNIFNQEFHVLKIIQYLAMFFVSSMDMFIDFIIRRIAHKPQSSVCGKKSIYITLAFLLIYLISTFLIPEYNQTAIVLCTCLSGIIDLFNYFS